LAPVSGIVRFAPSIVADRYSYLSCMGWMMIAAGGLCSLCQYWLNGKIRSSIFAFLQSVVIVVLLGLGVLTWQQIHVWHDSERLWRHALAVNQESGFAHYYLAVALARRDASHEAILHFERAVKQIDPSYAAYPDVHYELARPISEDGSTNRGHRALPSSPEVQT
jgi:tetratricopeptide (TPR) repeat protein